MIFSLLAVYRAPIEEVAEVWTAAFNLKRSPTEPGDGAWQEFVLPGVTDFLTFRKPAGYDCVWVEAHSTRFETPSFENAQKLFHHILTLPLRATEIILLDNPYIGGPIVTNHWHDEPIREMVEELERQSHCQEHSLRAYRLDILRDVDEWKGQAQEFDLRWQQTDEFAILDVHWGRRGKERTTFPDPLDKVPLQHATIPGLTEAMESSPQGTLFLLKLCAVGPNPERSPEPWRRALQEVAGALQACFGPRDQLNRLDYPRQFALLCPGLESRDAQSGLRNLARIVTHTRGPGAVPIEATAYSLSWPGDGETPEAIEQKLHQAFDTSPPLVSLFL